MSGTFRKGDHVYNSRFGRGHVVDSAGGRLVIRFEDGTERTVLDPAALHLERIETPVRPPEPAPPADDDVEEVEMDRDEMRQLMAEVLEEILGPADAELSDRWRGGTMVLKPGRPDTQSKEIPLDKFFEKITRVRDQLRVLEQKINTNRGLDAADRVAMQQYITRCYGSLTTFNVLFKNAEERFVGSSDGDRT